MKFTMIMLLTVLVSCGGSSNKSNTATQPGPVPNEPLEPAAPIESLFQTVTPGTGLHGLETIDLRGVTKNQEQQEIIGCNGTYGNSGKVNGVSEGKVLFTDDGVQFGHLAYVNASNAELCRQISKERYSYKIKGDVMTLCMLNYTNADGSLKYCTDYNAIQ